MSAGACPGASLSLPWRGEDLRELVLVLKHGPLHSRALLLPLEPGPPDLAGAEAGRSLWAVLAGDPAQTGRLEASVQSQAQAQASPPHTSPGGPDRGPGLRSRELTLCLIPADKEGKAPSREKKKKKKKSGEVQPRPRASLAPAGGVGSQAGSALLAPVTPCCPLSRRRKRQQRRRASTRRARTRQRTRAGRRGGGGGGREARRGLRWRSWRPSWGAGPRAATPAGAGTTRSSSPGRRRPRPLGGGGACPAGRGPRALRAAGPQRFSGMGLRPRRPARLFTGVGPCLPPAPRTRAPGRLHAGGLRFLLRLGQRCGPPVPPALGALRADAGQRWHLSRGRLSPGMASSFAPAPELGRAHRPGQRPRTLISSHSPPPPPGP